MKDNIIQQITVKGVLRQNDCVLFVKDTKGHWELPGGRIDFGEEPRETLKRELKEELDIKDVEIGEILDAWSFTSSQDKNPRQFIVLIYNCNGFQRYFSKLSDEVTDYKFIPIPSIKDLDMRQEYKDSIAKILHKSELDAKS